MLKFNELSRAEKITMINIAAVMVNIKLIKVPLEQFDEEEIMGFLTEKAEYLFNKSDLWKN